MGIIGKYIIVLREKIKRKMLNNRKRRKQTSTSWHNPKGNNDTEII